MKPIINVNWEDLKKDNILDSDFYLADLFVDDKDTQQLDDDLTIRDSLFVVFQHEGYKIAKENLKQMFDAAIGLKNKETYLQFWKRYKRPPVKECQDFIIERRDLLVPQDIRERKGAFFTPRIWVELSQKYLTDYLGENWQDDYYIWDCAAGTGNLLAGLTNKYNIYASTLDQADVKVIHERIEHGANLLKNNVFQFDFLNDDFSTLPHSLQEIINNPEKRKKLVIYINPPYAEAGSVNVTDIRKNKSDVSNSSKIWKVYKEKLGLGIRELFVQFYIRINEELKGCKLASFSKLKYVNGDGFKDFRGIFQPEYINGFIVPADTFDNVKGKFPISFLIWDFHRTTKIYSIKTDVYNKDGVYTGAKNFYSNEGEKRITEWVNRLNIKNQTNVIGYTGNNGPDFQNNNYCLISSIRKINSNGVVGNASKYNITTQNLLHISIYFSVRHCIDATWINDRDQFLYPNDGWQFDSEFQNDCLAFTLFYGQNRITNSEGTNHWIPFTEQEVNAKAKFESNFMTDFIKGKIKKEVPNETLFKDEVIAESKSLVFSDEATAVFDAGRELWKYYHAQNDVDINVNASFYDIRAYFQGTNEKGNMNARSEDVAYTKLIGELRNKLSVLADKIKPKVYEYEFLKE